MLYFQKKPILNLMKKQTNEFYINSWKNILKFILFISIFSVAIAFAQNQEDINKGTKSNLSSKVDTPPQNQNNKQKAVNKKNSGWFIFICSMFLGLVFFGYPFICKYKTNNKETELKGLNLPQGSIRAMIAIAIIGLYVITLSIGSLFIGADEFDMILTAFGSLSGAVIGFYFGSGGSGGKNSRKDQDKT